MNAEIIPLRRPRRTDAEAYRAALASQHVADDRRWTPCHDDTDPPEPPVAA